MTDNITTAVGGRTRRTVDVSTAETAARAILAMFEELQERQNRLERRISYLEEQQQREEEA
jgi:hypothetical protein